MKKVLILFFFLLGFNLISQNLVGPITISIPNNPTASKVGDFFKGLPPATVTVQFRGDLNSKN
jgi:hypothetical protein